MNPLTFITEAPSCCYYWAVRILLLWLVLPLHKCIICYSKLREIFVVDMTLTEIHNLLFQMLVYKRTRILCNGKLVQKKNVQNNENHEYLLSCQFHVMRYITNILYFLQSHLDILFGEVSCCYPHNISSSSSYMS